MDKPRIRTRFAPSPTGNLHVGSARAALFNELFARQHKGEFIIRIEDTDIERSRAEFEENILDGLRWLGLRWQEGPDLEGGFGPYRQSERRKMHRAALQSLLSDGQAYQKIGEKAVWLKVRTEEVVFDDLIRGPVKTQPEAWGNDFIIARGPDDPLFHLAVVVDDAAQEISHVIRGEDHISNTARHILLQRALGLPTPAYAHLPLLLDIERRKLSKRAGETDLLAFRDKGYLPEAMLNYLVLLGWNPKTREEFFTHEELVERFTLADVQKGGAIFTIHKLNDFNKHYIRTIPDDRLLAETRPFMNKEKLKDVGDDYLVKALKTESSRVATLKELGVAIDFFLPGWAPGYEPELLIWKKSDAEATRRWLAWLLEELDNIPEDEFTEELLSVRLLKLIDEEGLGRGDVLWPMRVALTGLEHSPGPFEVAAVIKKKESISRLNYAIAQVRN